MFAEPDVKDDELEYVVDDEHAIDDSSATETEEEEEDEDPPTKSDDSDTWRLREMGDTILFRHRPKDPMVGPPWRRFTTAVDKIRIQNPVVVQRTFDAAAGAVLRALSDPATTTDDDDDDDVDQRSSSWRDYLPDFSKERALAKLRIASFQHVLAARDQALAGITVTTATTTTLNKPGTDSSMPTVRQFTRNTPASTASSLDARSHNSRAVLSVAANLVVSVLTHGDPIDSLYGLTTTTTTTDTNTDSGGNTINWGAVVLEAQTIADRCIAVVENAIRRSMQRMEYRIQNAKYDLMRRRLPFGGIFSSRPNELPLSHKYEPHPNSQTYMWQTLGLPRFRKILTKTGAGHAIFYDVHWTTRHGRIASALHSMVENDDRGGYGPHLILTTTPEVEHFCREFPVRFRQPKLGLFAAAYTGTEDQRTNLRRDFGTPLGLSESAVHVVVVSIQSFLQDFLHFCQVPWHTVVVDDGVAWMCASKDGGLATLWDTLFSSNDQHVGLAGTLNAIWDFTKPTSIVKDALIGLTARHRILTASSLSTQYRQSVDLVPVGSMLQFLLPNFVSCVREEWDRSKIVTDAPCMKHFRKLAARSVVVHMENPTENDPYTLALNALNGRIPPEESDEKIPVPQTFSDEEFCSDGKLAFSRRNNLLWLGPQDRSWLRYELGVVDFTALMATVKSLSDKALSTCEEITTASSTTSSGATGQVAGTMAYRCAVRCGRHFGSEQGLRQHINAHHAPSGTWLCRVCAIDCITSPSRTHHERTCGQPSASSNDAGTVGATATVGQGGTKASAKKRSKASKESEKEKDADGSFKVPGYRGVWVNKAGKHFVKVEGKSIYMEGDSKDLLLFDKADEAAKKYDEKVLASGGVNKSVEFNFNDDGSRIVYDESSVLTTSLGGSAANVVPALSVINIKDLPPDVKPLLRDPRQTSRTGGNSKRHIYAYRGVCRQARKGHDRWQSQISFMGVNHYLGTFDSEWDAAAIYAWAHLILYGEEATRQAQREGEEAAAAYEQEKRDIAEGKIPEPLAKPDKKKKTPAKKRKIEKDGSADEMTPKKRKPKETSSAEKKPRATGKMSKAEKDFMASLVLKGMTQAPVLAPIFSLDPSVVADMACKKARLAKEAFYFSTASAPPAIRDSIRPCLPERYSIGRALLLGLSPSHYGWDLQQFCEKQDLATSQDAMAVLQMLAVEYDDDGTNETFSSVMQGTFCVIGNASRKLTKIYNSLGIGTIPLGGSAGSLDCHIGGVPGSCTERAACIQYDDQLARFKFCCLSPTDRVTINGNYLTVEEGYVEIRHMDVFSVGARVLVFLCQ